MPDYSHLQTDIADTRYVMAAHFLEPCQHIVEVGGNRIRHFMRDEHPRDRNPRHFWSIDPSAEAEHWERARTYNMPVTAFNFGNALRLKKQNGLCLLGLEMYDENEDDDEISSIQHVCENAGHFDRVVIEFVESNYGLAIVDMAVDIVPVVKKRKMNKMNLLILKERSLEFWKQK